MKCELMRIVSVECNGVIELTAIESTWSRETEFQKGAMTTQDAYDLYTSMHPITDASVNFRHRRVRVTEQDLRELFQVELVYTD
jgi:hypothetical protein